MLTISLYNETGKDVDPSEMMKSMEGENPNEQNEFRAQKRIRRGENKSKSNIPVIFEDDFESSEPERNIINNNINNISASTKNNIKKESPEDEVNKIFKMGHSVEEGQPSKTKFIYKIILDNTRNNEFSQIGLDELWTLVSKNKDFSKHNIKSKSDLLDILLALDFQGKCLYSEGDKTITLI